MSKFADIAVGAIFKADGNPYKKLGANSYQDFSSNLEVYWDPFFDSKIEIAGETTTASSTPTAPPAFNVDLQSRILTPNPAFKTLEEAFAELWGSGLFDCGPQDYGSIVEECLKAVKEIRAKATKKPRKPRTKKVSTESSTS